jgi:Chaperone of endosialidase
MGNLVFQATLGGQVNLVGPNTASTFNLNVPAVSSTLATLTGTETFTNKTLTTPTISQFSSASATNLTIQSAGTTAVTIDTSQNVGIGTSSPNLGGFSKALSINGTTPGLEYQISGSAAGYIFCRSDGNAGLNITRVGANPIVFTTNSTEAARIDSSGNLLVGQTSTILTGTIQFTFDGQNRQGMCIKNSANSTNGAAIRFIDYTNAYTGGGIYFSSSNSISYNTSSDYRLKENIAPMTGALTKIQQLKPVTFNWKQDKSESQGFIAHELQAVIPQSVTGEKDAVDSEGNPRYQGVDTSYIVATLTAAIQELKAINDQQAETLTRQTEAINALTARVVALEAK